MHHLFSQKYILAFFLALGFLVLPGTAAARDSEIYTGFFNKVAVGGYDSVAYFTQNRPVKGDTKFSTQYKGVEWRFANEEHKSKFIANPEQYAPQYGGYCAWAVAQGHTASGDPTKWKIVDGKLYLNYDADVQKKWEADVPGFISKANKNWPTVLN
jgi:YHS domain-containing protein